MWGMCQVVVSVPTMVNKGDLIKYNWHKMNEDESVLESYCRVCIAGMDKECHDMSVEI